MLLALLSGLVEVTHGAMAEFPIVSDKDSYSIAPEEVRELTETDSGNIIARLVFTPVYDDVEINWLLSESQFVFFRSWFDGVIQHGTQWFPLRVNVGREPCAETKTRLCFFRDKPCWKAVRIGGDYRITARLRVRSN